MMISKPFENCYWVVPGKFLAGEYPGSIDDEEAKKRIDSLLRFGVSHFIDLTGEEDNLKPYAHLLGGQRNGVRFSRFPLPDVQVPASKKDTSAILDTIDQAIQGGRMVYLHCWGGVGRTGLIVGCWLARHGRHGEAALNHLHEIWKHCPKSRYRKSPETREQERYVLNWSEDAISAVQSRYLGSMLGLAVGDALGTTLEFKHPGTFQKITGIVGGGPFALKKGEWTDDTSMALCLADSLLSCRGFNLHDQMARYLRWRDEGYMSSNGTCFDIGSTVADAISRFKRTGNAVAGSTNEYSAGNGSLMRLAPVPLFHASDIETAIANCGESSRTTHGNTACIDACRFYGALIVGAIMGESKEELLSCRYSPLRGLWEREPLCPAIDEVACGSFKEKSPPDIVGSGYVVKSLEAALWAFHNTGTFREGCLLAVNLGDDADTTGAIYGQLAGAFYGLNAIPAEWWQSLAHLELIHTFALGLHKYGARGVCP
jgi:ADP-ribosyl-[dinitrogen reductase] hydrolase